MMQWRSARTRRLVVFIGYLLIAFALYAAAEAGSGVAEIALLAGMIGLMLLAIYTG